LRFRLLVFVSIIQSVLFLGHWFVYVTWDHFYSGPVSSGTLKVVLAALSVSFVVSSLAGWYSHHWLVRIAYTLSAVWLGFASYFLWAGVLCWLVQGLNRIAGFGWSRPRVAIALFSAAAVTGIYGMINAARLRVTRINVMLPGLPAQWRGRKAALVSDIHLGLVRNGRFIRRIVRRLAELNPNIVFLAGDIYDGTSADFTKLAEPWREITTGREGADAPVPLGVYYIAGNHEEFYSHAEYHGPLVAAGVRELNNQKVEVDSLQLVGVHYSDAAHPDRYRQILRRAALDRSRASVLLLHAPLHLEVAEQEGISLQLSGHTHGGQFLPYAWIANRVWGRFVHGLQRAGNLLVYTNYGAGTWGPPMRVGTFPEIVLIEFE
jgi:predicted MPP superfamily phosphohydrolase